MPPLIRAGVEFRWLAYRLARDGALLGPRAGGLVE